MTSELTGLPSQFKYGALKSEITLSADTHAENGGQAQPPVTVDEKIPSVADEEPASEEHIKVVDDPDKKPSELATFPEG